MTTDHLLSCSLEELRSYDCIEQVDIVCTAFEEAWKQGTQLNLRECVSWVEPAYQEEVLRELILVEKECREFHPPVSIETPNEFLTFDSKLAAAGTIDNFFNDTIRTESKPNQLPLYIDRFAILRFLGRGSYGDVYEAQDVTINRRVAVKVAIHPNKTSRTFAKEAENANKVGHPGIVNIYEVGTWRGLDYLVSELIDGKPLGAFRDTAQLDLLGCARVVSELAYAIAAAHAQGVIHRDLKPSNIMIEAANRSLGDDEIHLDPSFEHHKVRVLDFGIAKLDGRETKHTRAGDILGTPHYMSPEQASGRADSLDGRSDIYSMGIILYELLTGKLPFEGTESVVINSIRTLKPPRVRSIRPDIPAALDSIVNRCLETDPANRYPTATELASDLNAWIEGRKPRSIAIDEQRRLAVGLAWVAAACLLVAASIAAARFLSLGSTLPIANLPAPTNTEPATKPLDGWVKEGNLADLASWLSRANETKNWLIFSDLDAWRLDGDLSSVQSDRVKFVDVCIAERRPDEAHSKDTLLGFMTDLELSQMESLEAFLGVAPSWMIGSFQSLPKTELADMKRPYLYRGLAQRLRTNGDGEQLLELLRLSESAELPEVLKAMIETASDSAEWKSKIREHFDNAKMNSQQSTEELDSVGRWKAKCALVAYGLGEMNIVDEVLGFAQTPQARNYFIYWLSNSSLPLEPLLDRMGQYNDDWHSTGVVAVMSLVPKISPSLRESWTERFQVWYREHPSPGVHTGTRLMLQKWGHDNFVREVDASPEFRNIANDRNWYMNSQGMQMNIVRGPVEFWYGNSPTSRSPGSKQTIDYSFAYSDQIVSEVQYARFRSDRFLDPKDQPAVGINFFDSVAYCDWLSAQEGIAKGESIKWVDEKNYELEFLHAGYRPPTILEWECFVRAGATSSLVFGEPDSEYAKTSENTPNFGPRFVESNPNNRPEWSSTAVRPPRAPNANSELDTDNNSIWQRSVESLKYGWKAAKANSAYESTFRVIVVLYDLERSD